LNLTNNLKLTTVFGNPKTVVISVLNGFD
jgi:hypothetical protein